MKGGQWRLYADVHIQVIFPLESRPVVAALRDKGRKLHAFVRRYTDEFDNKGIEWSPRGQVTNCESDVGPADTSPSESWKHLV